MMLQPLLDLLEAAEYFDPQAYNAVFESELDEADPPTP